MKSFIGSEYLRKPCAVLFNFVLDALRKYLKAARMLFESMLTYFSSLPVDKEDVKFDFFFRDV